ncbi:MAG: enoyl-CoA hydratase, partial [Deltaproteobacteria bacterium]|nr:enoyl-CoA hydratase [Deltaproteobacteria bacterium]
MNKLVQLEITSGIGVLTLNRPEGFNAFHAPMIGNLAEMLIALSSNEDVVGVV